MTPPEIDALITKILSANKLEDILAIGELDKEYKQIIVAIHPDRCTHSDASKASARLNEFKDLFEKGKVYKDETGDYRTNGYWVKWVSDQVCVKWSFENYDRFTKLSDDPSIHFRKYLPETYSMTGNNEYQFGFERRTVPLSGQTLPQEHVNWVLNRLLEYCAYLDQTGFSHAGLNPESVFIVPENHGIKICSFYHLTRIGSKVKTIAAKYSDWYPKELFTTKRASPTIDIELSKRIAAYLLGDKSGVGVKLRKTHNEQFVNFLLKHHDDPYQALIEYRALLAANFEKKFHILSL